VTIFCVESEDASSSGVDMSPSSGIFLKESAVSELYSAGNSSGSGSYSSKFISSGSGGFGSGVGSTRM
jgi:hypothetical protein